MLNTRPNPVRAAFVADAASKIHALAPGDEFTLVSLFGDDWQQPVANTKPQLLGNWFSQAVARGEVPNVREDGIQRSPRASLWLKT